MPKIFVDSDVCLDLLMKRDPFYDNAAALFSLGNRGELAVAISSVSFVNIHYFLKKFLGNRKALKILAEFRKLVKISVVDERSIDEALLSNFTDFEDAVQHFSAIQSEMDLIITRNIKHYKSSQVPVYTPENYLKNFT